MKAGEFGKYKDWYEGNKETVSPPVGNPEERKQDRKKKK
jgi:hypothetical protein